MTAKRKAGSVTRVDKLAPEQEARFGEWRDKWIKIGLSTEPADRPRFEAAVADCYRFAGLAPPKRVVWVQSPLVVAFAGPIASLILWQRANGKGGAVGGRSRSAAKLAGLAKARAAKAAKRNAVNAATAPTGAEVSK